MRLPDAVFTIVKEERARFGAIPTDVELGIMLNRMAWRAGVGFGLSRKDSSTRAPFPGGGSIAHDVLMRQDGTAWDVLHAAGAAATPVQGESFVITDPARGWIAPVDPDRVTPPGPSLPPGSELEHRFAVLEARVAHLTEMLTDGFDVSLLTHTGHWLSVQPAAGETPPLIIEGRAQSLPAQPSSWERLFLKPR
jgi:hypothetical protein